MVPLRNLEIHVTHACNLACVQCSHYSNDRHRGMLTSQEADRQMSLWSGRLQPKLFSLLGGEPCLNPELCEIVLIAKRHWTHSQLQLVTNGFLLSKHPDLPQVLAETGCKLEISVHHDSPEYQSRLEPVRAIVSHWESQFPIQVHWRASARRWRRTYRGSGPTMLPYRDNNQQQSWDICNAKWCPQLFDSQLWKCPQIAYLSMQLRKHNIYDAPEWQPYLNYSPLSPDCSEEQLAAFVRKEDEDVCRMCPAVTHLFELESPLR